MDAIKGRKKYLNTVTEERTWKIIISFNTTLESNTPMKILINYLSDRFQSPEREKMKKFYFMMIFIW